MPRGPCDALRKPSGETLKLQVPAWWIALNFLVRGRQPFSKPRILLLPRLPCGDSIEAFLYEIRSFVSDCRLRCLTTEVASLVRSTQKGDPSFVFPRSSLDFFKGPHVRFWTGHRVVVLQRQYG